MQIPLATQFEAADSLLDLVRALGEHCLDHGGPLAELLDDEDIKPISDSLERKVAAFDPELWQRPGPTGNYAHMLDLEGLRDSIELAEVHHPIEYRAVLRGLCRTALPHFFLATEERVPLHRGTPVPLVSRPVNDLFPDTTPHHTTMTLGHPLEMLAYGLYEYSAEDTASVELDYSYRERIDELTWTSKNRLPRIATLHPFLGARNIAIGHRTQTWFFDVKPKSWSLDNILAQLRGVANVEIAVLPELCLPIADALQDALAANPSSYPPLIVAGSAHVRERNGSGEEIRANESHVYLDGQPVVRHRKIHPFRTKHLGGHDLDRSMREGITTERKTITVLSGEHTRLAVVICADLNDIKIPRYLESAGVNLLLVPALTGGVGAFNGAICGLASKCQAIAVIVNAGLDPLPEESKHPFHVMAAVPRPAPEEQSRKFRDTKRRRTGLGIVDPNQPLRKAMTWTTSR